LAVPFRLQIAPSARKRLARLDPITASRVYEELKRLRDSPWHPGVVKLTGSSPWWRAKVGGLRIIYSIHPQSGIVRVALIEQRGRVHRETERLTYIDPDVPDR